MDRTFEGSVSGAVSGRDSTVEREQRVNRAESGFHWPLKIRSNRHFVAKYDSMAQKNATLHYASLSL